MEIRRIYIVEVNGKLQILYSTAIKYFVTSNGAFNQRETFIEEISSEQAWELLEPKGKKPKGKKPKPQPK
jgi:hypothetical protein